MNQVHLSGTKTIQINIKVVTIYISLQINRGKNLLLRMEKLSFIRQRTKKRFCVAVVAFLFPQLSIPSSQTEVNIFFLEKLFVFLSYLLLLPTYVLFSKCTILNEMSFPV